MTPTKPLVDPAAGVAQYLEVMDQPGLARGAPEERRWTTSVDVLLAAGLVALAILTGLVADTSDPGDMPPSSLWEWLLLVSPALPLLFRSSAPLIATPVAVVAQLGVWGIGLANPFLAPLVLMYSVSADEGRRGRRVAVVSGIALVAMSVLGFLVAEVTADLVVFTSIACVMAYVLGLQAANRRRAEVALAEELVVTRLETDAARTRAAAEERQRIARELHDIVGHSLSIIAVRAEAADRVAPKNPRAAVDAVGAIATTARSSLADVRRVLAGLRSGETDPELAPVPSLDSLPALVSSFSEAGLEVSVDIDVPVNAAVAATVGVGAYRIVQEALTNVLKHAGPSATAALALSVVGKDLVVRILDDGRGSDPGADGALGNGLTGMSERAEVLGGQLRAGPSAGGGYQVVATLPVEVKALSTNRPEIDR